MPWSSSFIQLSSIGSLGPIDISWSTVIVAWMATLVTFFNVISGLTNACFRPLSCAVMISHSLTALSSPDLLLLSMCNMPLCRSTSLYALLSASLSCRPSCPTTALSPASCIFTSTYARPASSGRISSSSLLPYAQITDVTKSDAYRFMPSMQMCSFTEIHPPLLKSHSMTSRLFSEPFILFYVRPQVVSR